MTAPTCWTCGAEMDPETYRMAPREPEPNEHLRTCIDCHYTVEMLGGDLPLRVCNMIRFAAGVPVRTPLDNGHAIAPPETDQNGSNSEATR